MKKSIVLSLLLLLFGTIAMQAQKKKDLLGQIEKLRNQIKNTEQQLTESKQQVRLTAEKLELSQTQTAEAQKGNQELLQTINSFASVSKQKANNLTTSLETIKQKDTQLKVVNDALAAAENEKLRRLTIFRDGLGTIGKIGYQNNILVIAIPNISLYGEDDTAIILTEAGKKNILKIGELLTKYPEYAIIIEGNSNALEFKEKELLKDNWDLSALQATAIAKTLQVDSKIDPKRMETSAKSEYNTTGVETVTRILIKPTFDAFFNVIKEGMKP